MDKMRMYAGILALSILILGFISLLEGLKIIDVFGILGTDSPSAAIVSGIGGILVGFVMLVATIMPMENSNHSSSRPC